MAIVKFVATSAELGTGVGELFEKSRPYISYRVRLDSNESIMLSSGENFGDLDDRVTVHSYVDSSSGKSNVGQVFYFPASADRFDSISASYIVDVRMPTAQMDELLAAARAGRMPSMISVEIDAMEYDWQPDGSGKKWDNKNARKLDVGSVLFTIPLAALDPGNVSSDGSVVENMPPTRAQVGQLSERVERLARETKTAVRVLVLTALIVGVLVLLRR